MSTREINITMAERIVHFGTKCVHPTDGSNVTLVSKTGIPLNECCGCIHEDDCILLEFYGSLKMPCEVEND